MALLLAPISVADFSGMESEMLMTAVLAGEMVLLGGARESKGVVVACDVALHSKSFAGIFLGEDPPMVKSATDQ